MSITFNTKTYTADSYGSNAVGYVGAANTVSVKDQYSLKRTAPKPTAVFSGVGRTSAKLTRTLTLTGALNPTWDAIAEINFTVPVGAATSDVEAMIDDLAAAMAATDFSSFVQNQKISF